MVFMCLYRFFNVYVFLIVFCCKNHILVFLSLKMSAVIMDHGETSTRMDIEVARGFDNNPMLSPLKNQNQDGSGGFFGSGFDYGKLNNNNNRKMSSGEKDISPDEIVLNTGAKFEIGPHLEVCREKDEKSVMLFTLP